MTSICKGGKMPTKENCIERIIEEVKRSLKKKKVQSISHRTDHFERVWQRAESIAKKIMEEQNIVIDMEALKIACWIHDLNESYKGKKVNHVKDSMADGKALMLKVGYPENRINVVLGIVSEHSSESIKAPTSIEAKILFDADKLDGLGAIGIARVFALCGQQGLSIAETAKWYRAKIQKAIPYMKTDMGKKLATKNLPYVISYLEKIEKEEAELKTA